jgi:hypothetical protein
MFIGSNQGQYAAIGAAVPGLNGQRVYYDTIPNTWPQTWPATPAGVLACLSIRPYPADLLAGTLDADIKSLAFAAPAGSLLTAWHEAGSLPYPSYVTAQVMQEVHAKMHSLVIGSGLHYGSVSYGNPARAMEWTIPGLGFYGLDLYDGGSAETNLPKAMSVFAASVTSLNNGSLPRIAITETNSKTQPRRPYWFSALSGWLHGYGGQSLALLTYWNPTGPMSGPWVPGDTATITALQNVVQAG